MENNKDKIIKLDSTYFECDYFIKNIKIPKFIEWDDLEHEAKRDIFKPVEWKYKYDWG